MEALLAAQRAGASLPASVLREALEGCSASGRGCGEESWEALVQDGLGALEEACRQDAACGPLTRELLLRAVAELGGRDAFPFLLAAMSEGARAGQPCFSFLAALAAATAEALRAQRGRRKTISLFVVDALGPCGALVQAAVESCEQEGGLGMEQADMELSGREPRAAALPAAETGGHQLEERGAERRQAQTAPPPPPPSPACEECLEAAVGLLQCCAESLPEGAGERAARAVAGAALLALDHGAGAWPELAAALVACLHGAGMVSVGEAVALCGVPAGAAGSDREEGGEDGQCRGDMAQPTRQDAGRDGSATGGGSGEGAGGAAGGGSGSVGGTEFRLSAAIVLHAGLCSGGRYTARLTLDPSVVPKQLMAWLSGALKAFLRAHPVYHSMALQLANAAATRMRAQGSIEQATEAQRDTFRTLYAAVAMYRGGGVLGRGFVGAFLAFLRMLAPHNKAATVAHMLREFPPNLAPLLLTEVKDEIAAHLDAAAHGPEADASQESPFFTEGTLILLLSPLLRKDQWQGEQAMACLLDSTTTLAAATNAALFLVLRAKGQRIAPLEPHVPKLNSAAPALRALVVQAQAEAGESAGLALLQDALGRLCSALA